MASLEVLAERGWTVCRRGSRADSDALPEVARGRSRTIVTGGSPGAAPTLAEALPALESIDVSGAGADAAGSGLCGMAGVRVTSTPGAPMADVADLALGLTLAVLRSLCGGDHFAREGRRDREGLPLSSKLSGKRLSIVGLGRVGRPSPSEPRAEARRRPAAR